MAQGTKVNMCELFITKVDILSFVIPKYRTLVPAIGLIYILQLGTLNESVFFFLCQDTAAAIMEDKSPDNLCLAMYSLLLMTTRAGKQVCSLELSCRQQEGKILNPLEGSDPFTRLSPCHWGVQANSVRLFCLLIIQWTYSLKPPGASQET